MKNTNFEKFASVITTNPWPTAQDSRLLLQENDGISVYYAPFDHVNTEARIALVGITPGPTQMVNSIVEARRSLESGDSHETAQEHAKVVASFSGEPMRSNLINQLNHWGFHKWLGIDNCSELFSSKKHLLHSTSLLRYPVFVDGKDYAGTPNMVRTPILREYLHNYFAEEINGMSQVIFLSLGPKVSAVMQHLSRNRVIDANRVVNGLLHPSGNNTYRVKWLIGDRKSDVPYRTNPEPYDEGRKQFQRRFLGLA